MNITISDTARKYLKNKQEFYLSNSRKPRVIIVAKSCRGAEFRLVFEVPDPEDIILRDKECELYVSAALLEEYGGFSLDTEVFFFSHRLLVQPMKQKYTCDCSTKCNIEER